MEFRLLMESNFECLRYCDSHWKVERLWIAYYPTWLKGALKRAAEAKKAAEEAKKSAEAGVIVIDDEADDGNKKDGKNAAGKRSRPDDNETGRSKRPRVEEVHPTQPPTKVTTKRARVCALT